MSALPGASFKCKY